MNRRNFAKLSALFSLFSGTTISGAQNMRSRFIPSSNEAIPVIGLGTWQTFDVGTDSVSRENLAKVLKTFVAGGGSVVDSSPMYGNSESVVGELAEQIGVGAQLFKATKVWTSGEQEGVQQMHRSMHRMKTPKMDLMQVHNFLDVHTHLETLAKWKREGKIRYLGITHYHSGGYAEMLSLMTEYDLDFIQINYSILSREVEEEILPLASEKGIAVIINRPFEKGRLFSRVRGVELPVWAKQFDCETWGQFFLKFILASPAVTCVIPGTSKVHHMQDNLAAGYGRLPNLEQKSKMVEFLNEL